MILEKLEQKDSRREELDTIAKEATRCRDIVRGLLDFARQRKLQVENVDVNRILEEGISLVTAQPAFQRVQIAKTLDPSLPATEGDPVQLKEVFLNILSNAGEAMPQGGKVTVVSRFLEAGSHPIEIMIRDTGQGIPQENLNKIFMPFSPPRKSARGPAWGWPLHMES